MAVYRCEECQEWMDNDYCPCAEHPTIKNGLVCPDCADELEEDEDDPNYDPSPYCSHCGAQTKASCDCGPIPRND